MKVSTLFALLMYAGLLQAQSDILPTPAGEIKMTPILHSTMVLEWQEFTFYIDPYGGADRFDGFGDADVVVITHAHGDHMNTETLAELDLKGSRLVAPASVVDKVNDIEFGAVSSLQNGDKLEGAGWSIEAVPMYNLPNDETARHKKGWGNGYILTIGGQRIYISGDTEDIPEMRELQNIDYAFVCMNLPYTMTVDAAADAVLDFKPKVVYPFHYRGQDGFSDVDHFRQLVNVNPDIEVRLRNWYPENQ